MPTEWGPQWSRAMAQEEDVQSRPGSGRPGRLWVALRADLGEGAGWPGGFLEPRAARPQFLGRPLQNRDGVFPRPASGFSTPSGSPIPPGQQPVLQIQLSSDSDSQGKGSVPLASPTTDATHNLGVPSTNPQGSRHQNLPESLSVRV